MSSVDAVSRLVPVPRIPCFYPIPCASARLVSELLHGHHIAGVVVGWEPISRSQRHEPQSGVGFSSEAMDPAKSTPTSILSPLATDSMANDNY